MRRKPRPLLNAAREARRLNAAREARRKARSGTHPDGSPPKRAEGAHRRRRKRGPTHRRPTTTGRRRKAGGGRARRATCGVTHRRLPTTAARRKAGGGRAALAEGGERRAPRARLRARRAANKKGGVTPLPLCPKGAQLSNRRTLEGWGEEGKGKSRGGPTINEARHNSYCACKGGKKGEGRSFSPSSPLCNTIKTVMFN